MYLMMTQSIIFNILHIPNLNSTRDLLHADDMMLDLGTGDSVSLHVLG